MCVSLALVLAAAFLCLLSLMRGEEFSAPPGGDISSEVFAQRLMAAFCASIDHQIVALRRASSLTIISLVAMAATWGWILIAKM